MDQTLKSVRLNTAMPTPLIEFRYSVSRQSGGLRAATLEDHSVKAFWGSRDSGFFDPSLDQIFGTSPEMFKSQGAIL